MPKLGKGKLVDTFIFKDYGAVPVYFQKHGGKFVAEVYGDEYEAVSIVELRKAIEAGLAANVGLAWRQAIQVSMVMDGRGDESLNVVGLEYSRFYWTVRPDGETMSAHWGKYADDDKGVDPASLVKRAQSFTWNHTNDKLPFMPPCSYAGYSGDATYYLVYSADLWAGLGRLDDAIKALRQRVIEIVSTPAGQVMLAQAAGNLLAAPADKDSDHG